MKTLAIGCSVSFDVHGNVARASGRSATIAGRVLDQAGKTIPNAAVTVKNESGATVREVKTGDDGYFSATGLPPGKYTIEVSASGFTMARRTGIDVPGGASAEPIDPAERSEREPVGDSGSGSLSGGATRAFR